MCPDRRRPQRGLAAVELAILTPVFLLLMLGTAEFGRACYEYNTLTKAVREGARFLSARALNGAGVVDISDGDQLTAQRLVVYGNPGGTGAPRLAGFATDDVTIATTVPADGGTHVVITATYDYTPIFAVVPRFGQGEDIAAVGTMTATCAMVAM